MGRPHREGQGDVCIDIGFSEIIVTIHHERGPIGPLGKPLLHIYPDVRCFASLKT